MQICRQEATRSTAKRPLPMAACLITSTPDRRSQTVGHLARINSSAEDKYVVGESRADAVSKAVHYAKAVLGIPIESIEFPDFYSGR